MRAMAGYPQAAGPRGVVVAAQAESSLYMVGTIAEARAKEEMRAGEGPS